MRGWDGKSLGERIEVRGKRCRTGGAGAGAGAGAAALKRGHIDCRTGEGGREGGHGGVRARGALQGPLALKTKIKLKAAQSFSPIMVTWKP